MLEGGKPVPDVIHSAKTPALEKEIAEHPSLKPQQLLRFFCRLLMPGDGVLLDPFMGSGSTIAACDALRISSIGIELDPTYFALARRAIPDLAALYPGYFGETIEMATVVKSPAAETEQMLLLGAV